MKKIKNIALFCILLTASLYANKPSFDKVLTLQGITFHVVATNEGSLNQLTITPSGLEIVNRVSHLQISTKV